MNTDIHKTLLISVYHYYQTKIMQTTTQQKPTEILIFSYETHFSSEENIQNEEWNRFISFTSYVLQELFHYTSITVLLQQYYWKGSNISETLQLGHLITNYYQWKLKRRPSYDSEEDEERCLVAPSNTCIREKASAVNSLICCSPQLCVGRFCSRIMMPFNRNESIQTSEKVWAK